MTGRRPGEPIDVPPRGSAAPLDIDAVRGTDDLIEALSTRRTAPSEDDPAVWLLQSLIADVDQGAPPLPARRPVAPAPRSGRRGARTVVVLSVTTALLATTGVAAAGSGGLGGSLVRSSVSVVRQATALYSPAELTSACRAVMEGWSTARRGSTHGSGRTGQRAARSAGLIGGAARPGPRSLRGRTFGVRSLLRQGAGARTGSVVRARTGAWRLRRGTQRPGIQRPGIQGFERPSSLSMTPST